MAKKTQQENKATDKASSSEDASAVADTSAADNAQANTADKQETKSSAKSPEKQLDNKQAGLTQPATPSGGNNKKATAEKPQQKSTRSAASSPGKAAFSVIYLLLLVITAATAAAAYYFWQQQLQQQQRVASSSQQLERLQTELTQLEQQFSQESAKISFHEQSLQQLNQDLAVTTEISQQAMQLLQQNQRGWALAEIDYLLRMAHRRLQVARDIPGAIAALQGADSRIQQLGDLKLFKIRQQLNSDIAELKAIHQVDVSGIAMRLDENIRLVSELPFKSIQRAIEAQLPQTEETPQSEQSVEQSAEQIAEQQPGFVDSLISTVKQIGDIKIHQRSIQLNQGEAQQADIQQQLQSHLLALRLAVLSYNQKQFHYELTQSIELLQQHYDEEDNRVAQLLEQLQSYQQLNLQQQLPELIEAWELLQQALVEKPTAEDVQP
ncbi:MAG TPA: uroporphyrinogen-III C-methyltransferase [Gammaproteobacteria bacterium]